MAPEFFNSALNRKIPTGEVEKKHEITTIISIQLVFFQLLFSDETGILREF